MAMDTQQLVRATDRAFELYALALAHVKAGLCWLAILHWLVG